MNNPVYYERRMENEFIGLICDHPFPPHVHDVVEIVCMMEGTVEMTVDGHRLSVREGDVVVVFPSVPHSYDVVPTNVKGLSLIFQPDTIGEFSRSFRTVLPEHPLLTREAKDPALDELIRRLMVLSNEDHSPLMHGYLHLFLSYLFYCMPVRPAAQQLHTSLSSQVLRYVSDHFTEPLTLERMAHEMGISRIHLSHIFSQQLRINFRQHINALRVNHACTLLSREPGSSVSQIAYQCGYENLRTFHRAFQAQCGVTPGQFRRMRGLDAGDASTCAEDGEG